MNEIPLRYHAFYSYTHAFGYNTDTQAAHNHNTTSTLNAITSHAVTLQYITLQYTTLISIPLHSTRKAYVDNGRSRCKPRNLTPIHLYRWTFIMWPCTCHISTCSNMQHECMLLRGNCSIWPLPTLDCHVAHVGRQGREEIFHHVLQLTAVLCEFSSAQLLWDWGLRSGMGKLGLYIYLPFYLSVCLSIIIYL